MLLHTRTQIYEEDMVFICTEVLFSHDSEWSYVICRKTQTLASQRQVLYVLSHMRNLGDKKNTMDNMEVGQERVSIVNKKG